MTSAQLIILFRETATAVIEYKLDHVKINRLDIRGSRVLFTRRVACPRRTEFGLGPKFSRARGMSIFATDQREKRDVEIKTIVTIRSVEPIRHSSDPRDRSTRGGASRKKQSRRRCGRCARLMKQSSRAGRPAYEECALLLSLLLLRDRARQHPKYKNARSGDAELSRIEKTSSRAEESDGSRYG